MRNRIYDDQRCQQYADAQVAPLRDQANTQAIGSALLGAGLGAAVGGAVGDGRGAGIGAASGAFVGTGGWSLTRKTRRAICSSNTMPITLNAWRPAGIRHHHTLRQRQLTPQLLGTGRNRIIRHGYPTLNRHGIEAGTASQYQGSSFVSAGVASESAYTHMSSTGRRVNPNSRCDLNRPPPVR